MGESVRLHLTALEGASSANADLYASQVVEMLATYNGCWGDPLELVAFIWRRDMALEYVTQLCEDYGVRCHVLGLRDFSLPLDTLRLAAPTCIHTVIDTPHRIEDEHEADPAAMCQTVRDLQAELNSRVIPLTVLPGNEAIICSDLPDRVKKADVLTLADRGTHLLLDWPTKTCPRTWTMSSSGCSCGVPLLFLPTLSPTHTSAATGTSQTTGSSAAVWLRSTHPAWTAPEATTSCRI